MPGEFYIEGKKERLDLSAILTAIADLQAELGRLRGEAPVSGSVTASWQSGTGTSGDDGADLVTIGAINTKYKLHSLVVNISTMTAGTVIVLRLFMKVNGTERKVYQQSFTKGTDPDGLWIVNGTVGIHDILRLELQSDNAADNGKTIDYDYMLEVM
jgi:hypothetical protein